MESISYKKGYKYQLHEEYRSYIPIKPVVDIVSNGDYITLKTDGLLVIKKGYAWDGPSGPTIDTCNFMRGSLVHDGLYQLMREGKLLKGTYRDRADQLMRDICRQDGMSAIRAWWVYQGVKIFAASAADPKNLKPVFTAPH